jgi:hypothetical protein
VQLGNKHGLSVEQQYELFQDCDEAYDDVVANHPHLLTTFSEDSGLSPEAGSGGDDGSNDDGSGDDDGSDDDGSGSTTAAVAEPLPELTMAQRLAALQRVRAMCQLNSAAAAAAATAAAAVQPAPVLDVQILGDAHGTFRPRGAINLIL